MNFCHSLGQVLLILFAARERNWRLARRAPREGGGYPSGGEVRQFRLEIDGD